jgi:hypothetical protein
LAIHTTDWTQISATGPNAGADSALADGWTDHTGNLFETVGTSPSAYLTNTGTIGGAELARLNRPTTDTTGIADVQWVNTWTWIEHTVAHYNGHGMRFQGDGSGYNVFFFNAANNTQISLIARRVLSGGATHSDMASGTVSAALVDGHSYTATVGIQGSIITIRLFDNTASTFLTFNAWTLGTGASVTGQGTTTITVTDTNISAAGQACLLGYGVTGRTTLSILNNNTAALTDGGAYISAGTTTTITVNDTVTGGVAPLVTNLYANKTPGATAIGGNLKASSITLPYTWTLPDAGPWYFNLVTTDNASTVVTSNEMVAQPWLTEAVAFVGDSIFFRTGGVPPAGTDSNGPYAISIYFKGIAPGDGTFTLGLPGLTQLLYPANVTVQNQAHNGASIASFLKADPLSTGYYAALVTAMTSAGSTGLVVAVPASNDAAASLSAATVQTSLIQFLSDIQADVATLKRIMMWEPIYYALAGNVGLQGTVNGFNAQYLAVYDYAVAHGGTTATVVRGPKNWITRSAINLAPLGGLGSTDFGPHLAEYGAMLAGAQGAAAWANQFYGQSGGGGGGGGKGGGGGGSLGGGLGGGGGLC